METRQNGPQCRPDTALTPPPENCQDRELLEYLLRAEQRRLEVALRIEEDRGTVFPETTVIIRDIQKLHHSLQALNKPDEEPAGEAWDVTGHDDDSLAALLQAVAAAGR